MFQCRRQSFHGTMMLQVVVMTVAVAMVSNLPAAPVPVYFGLTPVFLDDQPRILKVWRDYLESRLARPVVFVQRGSYREITDLLLRGDLDVAWVCGLPFVERQDRLRLIAAPLYQGAPLYRSYLIVPREDQTTETWEDLAGGVFAFSDPDSNSGNLYPRYAMAQAQISPEKLFRKTFFARGHRNVVEAVAVGLADGGAVDGYVWDTLDRRHPELTKNTRVVLKSETFGFPPLVARGDLSPQDAETIENVLRGMTDDADGRHVLELLNLDGFAAVKPALYGSIREMARALGRLP